MMTALLSPAAMLAQQTWPPQPAWQQNGQYSQPYPQQYNQAPGYAQPQPYGQQPPGYPQQGYVGPDQQYAPDYPQPQPSNLQPQPQAQPLRIEQLEQLVAPIALYPDALVAQILAAATYPAQVVDADHWRQAQGNAPPDDIVWGANAQDWDPSLKALTAFPQVLAEMDQNLRWTIALGNAYYNQPQDVLDVVQVMRQRAQAAGNLQSNPQESVSYDEGYIQVAPANPQIVYLPAYDPWNSYGQPVEPYRGFSLTGALGSFFGSLSGSGAVRYGLGIALSAFTHAPWGWLGWGLDWLGHSLQFHNSNYYSHSATVADWGLPHGGPRARFQPSVARSAPNAREVAGAYRPNQPYDRGAAYPQDRPARAAAGYDAYNRLRAQANQQEDHRFTENRPTANGFRGNPNPTTGYERQPLEAYNRLQTPRSAFSNAQPYSRPSPGYGSGFYNRPAGGRSDARPDMADSSPTQTYRPQPSYPRGDFQNRSSGFREGRRFDGYSGKQPKSGGFHFFGGGHEKAPRGSDGGKSFGGGHHSDGGGHSRGHGGHRR